MKSRILEALDFCWNCFVSIPSTAYIVVQTPKPTGVFIGGDGSVAIPESAVELFRAIVPLNNL